MNRFLLPLLILLWSLLYTGWWNCNRKPLCSGEPIAAAATPEAAIPASVTDHSLRVVDTGKVVTLGEQILLTPLSVYFSVNQSSIRKMAAGETFIETVKSYFKKYQINNFNHGAY